MKKQTYIAYLKDENGNMITFERFACKRVKTAAKHIRELLANDLYRTCTKGAKTVEIYATPNGNNPELVPEYVLVV